MAVNGNDSGLQTCPIPRSLEAWAPYDPLDLRFVGVLCTFRFLRQRIKTARNYKTAREGTLRPKILKPAREGTLVPLMYETAREGPQEPYEPAREGTQKPFETAREGTPEPHETDREGTLRPYRCGFIVGTVV